MVSQLTHCVINAKNFWPHQIKECANVVDILCLAESFQQMENSLILYVFVLGDLNGMVAINVETGFLLEKTKY